MHGAGSFVGGRLGAPPKDRCSRDACVAERAKALGNPSTEMLEAAERSVRVASPARVADVVRQIMASLLHAEELAAAA